MSVAQVKKRFEEFESFLRKDKEALRRLKLLKDDVNVLRTSMAAALEAKQTADVIKDAARERADKAEEEAVELKREIERLKDINNSINQEAEILRKRLSEALDRKRVPFASGQLVEDLSPERIQKWAYKTLREQGGTLKKLTKTTTPFPLGFSIEDVLTGFDEYGFATLGRTIVLQLFVRQAITIFWRDDGDGVDPAKILKLIWKQDKSDKAKRLVMQLFRHQFDDRTVEDVLLEKTSGKSLFPVFPTPTNESTADLLLGRKPG